MSKEVKGIRSTRGPGRGHSLCGLGGVQGATGQSVRERGTAESHIQTCSIAHIGVRIGKYRMFLLQPRDRQRSAKGYRLQDLGSGLYMTRQPHSVDVYVYDRVRRIDATQNLASLSAAIAEVSDNLSSPLLQHSHATHIAAAKALGGLPNIIRMRKPTAAETRRRSEPATPTVPSRKVHAACRNQVLELSYPAIGHDRANFYLCVEPRV